MEYPLTGIKVLDLSRVLAGPYAGRMLAELGAEVVKVEPPEGDMTRNWGKSIGGITGYYNHCNLGKRGICVDMLADGAVDLIKDLVKEADILIENFRPGVMQRLGISYEILAAVNAKLIMLSISGFGQRGPESRRPAFASVIHAEAGLVSRKSVRTGDPHSDYPVSIGDTNASLHGLTAVLSALYLRLRTGEGQHIDISMVDATVATDDQLQYDLDDSHDTGPLPNDVWMTGLGPIILATDFRFFWRCLVDELGISDPTTKEMEFEHRIFLRREVTAKFMLSLNTLDQINEVLDRFNIPWGHVREASNLTGQPTLRERQTFVEVDDRAGGKRTVTQSPYRFSNAVSGIRGPAPHKGEHNDKILDEWLAADSKKINELKETGVLLSEDNNI
ncbi:MAG: CaiB/BaiF CoA transferase family protein [Candidatus Azotimanducaceae bacterium]|uniref:CoA transferase n=1 Tax=OM182 bacterium TaxID=2510334 RepID=A0A520S5Q2_9GAMM|nr:MAG: CoA transferase [OM182 bacterium]